MTQRRNFRLPLKHRYLFTPRRIQAELGLSLLQSKVKMLLPRHMIDLDATPRRKLPTEQQVRQRKLDLLAMRENEITRPEQLLTHAPFEQEFLG